MYNATEFCTTKTVYDLPLESVHPRAFNAYAITDIEPLARSIERCGLLQPVLVARDGIMFRIVAGERRYTAMKYLYDTCMQNKDVLKATLFSTIPAIILEDKDADQEDQVYRDTNDYSRQLTNFQRIVRMDPDQIDLHSEKWREKFITYIYGEEALPEYHAGKIKIKTTRREKSKLMRCMILEREPELDISEKTIRNYLAFFDRCNENLRLACVMGKISVRDAQALSWLTSNEQTAAVAVIGKEEMKDYLKEGRALSGTDQRKARSVSKQVQLKKQISDLSQTEAQLFKLLDEGSDEEAELLKSLQELNQKLNAYMKRHS